VRIPIKLSRANANANANANDNANANGDAHAQPGEDLQKEDLHQNGGVFIQNTIIEFGTSHEVLFAVNCPLEFADRVLVESKNGALRAEASVVAVQYHPERTVVAVRFLKPVPNWIVKS